MSKRSVLPVLIAVLMLLCFLPQEKNLTAQEDGISYKKVLYMHSQSFGAQMGVFGTAAQNYPTTRKTILKSASSIKTSVRMWDSLVEDRYVPDKFTEVHETYSSALDKYDEAMSLSRSGALTNDVSKILSAKQKMQTANTLLRQATSQVSDAFDK